MSRSSDKIPSLPRNWWSMTKLAEIGALLRRRRPAFLCLLCFGWFEGCPKCSKSMRLWWLCASRCNKDFWQVVKPANQPVIINPPYWTGESKAEWDTVNRRWRPKKKKKKKSRQLWSQKTGDRFLAMSRRTDSCSEAEVELLDYHGFSISRTRWASSKSSVSQ